MSSKDLPIVALVDDDDIFQMITSTTIRGLNRTSQILQFLGGDDALRFIQSHSSDALTLPDIIFLDINMPLVNGWMFLEEFAKLSSSLAKVIRIYMLSSSIDTNDMDRAKQIPIVSGYLAKPVPQDKFDQIIRSETC